MPPLMSRKGDALYLEGERTLLSLASVLRGIKRMESVWVLEGKMTGAVARFHSFKLVIET